MKRFLIISLLLLTLVFSSCSYPAQGLCFEARNVTYSDINGGSGFLKVITCGNNTKVVEENIIYETNLSDYPILEVS